MQEVQKLRVAVPVDGELVKRHFGRSISFVLATVEDGSVKDIERISAESLTHKHHELADFLQEEGVSMVIAGEIGEKAVNALMENGMDIITGVEGSYRQVLEDFAKGELKSKDLLCGQVGHRQKHEQYGHKKTADNAAISIEVR